MEVIINKIKQKKELSDLPDSLVSQVLKNYLEKNNLNIPKNKKEEKIIVKEIRSQLRKYAGRFQISSKKRDKLFKEGKIQNLLKTHTSTKERINHYPDLKNLIKKINPSSILDLGCGINPLAIAESKISYYAYDIKGSEINLINEYFKKKKVKGKAYVKDITQFSKFPKTDLCLILKVLDIIETKGHEKARHLLKKIKSKIIIVSFSTKTLSGKSMRVPRRKWFEYLADELNYSFRDFKLSNEIFYILRKSKE